MYAGKDIFWLTISLVIVTICSAQGYFIYKNEIDKKEKRKKLDSYYFEDLQTDYSLYLQKNNKPEDRTAWFREIMDVKKQMESDNYNKAEIEEISKRAREEAWRNR